MLTAQLSVYVVLLCKPPPHTRTLLFQNSIAVNSREKDDFLKLFFLILNIFYINILPLGR